MSFHLHKHIVTHAAAAAAGLLVFFVLHQTWSFIAPCHTRYNLLNPSLRCKAATSQGEWDYEPLRDDLTAKKEALKATGKITHLSVYFRDLDHGPRFGIGEYDKFQPASLTKLPIMIAFLHLADLDSSILNKTLSFTGSLSTNMNVEAPDQTIQPDTLYSVRELLEKMIVYSDNYSYLLLVRELNTMPRDLRYYTFHDLDILNMMLAPRADYVSISSYATLFAVLHNTGYLSKDMSQYALSLLSRATFREGIVAGVPADTIVAHKFGRKVQEGQDSQLHDCGIVYHPKMRYVLCVMTSGTDYGAEKEAIASVSRIVYDAINDLSME